MYKNILIISHLSIYVLYCQ